MRGASRLRCCASAALFWAGRAVPSGMILMSPSPSTGGCRGTPRVPMRARGVWTTALGRWLYGVSKSDTPSDASFFGQVVCVPPWEASGGPQGRLRPGGFAVSAKRAAKRAAPSGSPAQKSGLPRRRSILLARSARCVAEPKSIHTLRVLPLAKSALAVLLSVLAVGCVRFRENVDLAIGQVDPSREETDAGRAPKCWIERRVVITRGLGGQTIREVSTETSRCPSRTVEAAERLD